MKVLSILLLTIFANVFDTMNIPTETYKVKLMPKCVHEADFHIRILTEKGKINLLTIKHKEYEYS